MYPHSNDHSHTDTVHWEAPDYDLDIDGNCSDTPHNPRCVIVLINDTIEDEQSIPKLLDASSPKPVTTTFHLHPSQTNWPDAPTIQIPRVSSTSTDAPPEVVYHCRTTVYTADGEEVLEIEEDEYNQEYDNSGNHFITHHNTHQESERIRRKYSAQLQDLEDQQHYAQSHFP